MTELTTRGRGRQAPAATVQTKQDILNAAAILFAQKGFDACSIRDIATQANFAHGVIRHHFGSKQNIWMAIAESALEHYKTSLLPFVIEAAQSEEVLQGFKDLVRSFINETNLQPQLICLMAKEGTIESERSIYFRNEVKLIHKQITPLFERAKKECEALELHTSDSFFLSLFSLTIVPTTMSSITSFIPIGRQTKKQVKLREELILKMLFE